MTQYCRYCAGLVVGDINYCTTMRRSISEAAAKSVNKCKEFELNPIDAFWKNKKGYQPREKKKTQCDGQMKLFEGGDHD